MRGHGWQSSKKKSTTCHVTGSEALLYPPSSLSPATASRSPHTDANQCLLTFALRGRVQAPDSDLVAKGRDAVQPAEVPHHPQRRDPLARDLDAPRDVQRHAHAQRRAQVPQHLVRHDVPVVREVEDAHGRPGEPHEPRRGRPADAASAEDAEGLESAEVAHARVGEGYEPRHVEGAEGGGGDGIGEVAEGVVAEEGALGDVQALQVGQPSDARERHVRDTA